MTPSSIHLISNMVSGGCVGGDEVLFVATNHGRKLMLAQRLHVTDEIFLLILTPASFHKGSQDEADRSFLNGKRAGGTRENLIKYSHGILKTK